MQKIEGLSLALQDLLVGRLSRHFIETEVLQDHLNLLADTIKTHNPQARLVYPLVHYYYTAANVARAIYKYMDENTLIIIIKVPLTVSELAAPMNV